MEYSIHAETESNNDGIISIKLSKIEFGTTSKTADKLPNPAELFLGSFASCILKNVERFSELMQFSYLKTSIIVSATRLENPPRINQLSYKLTIYSKDQKLNIKLLKKNIEKFGTIYNTVKQSSSITGIIIRL